MKQTKNLGKMLLLFVLGFFLCLLSQCTSKDKGVLGPIPFPKDNPFNAEIAEFGKQLFFDKRLSLDNSVACATCHVPSKAFTDGKKLSEGIDGKLSMRNAPSLLNVAFQHTLMADGQVPTIEMQALVPLRDSAEMANNIHQLLIKLNSIKEYRQKSLRLFNKEMDAYVLTRSLANFQRTLISDNSPFDRYYYKHEESAISKEAKYGWKIFSEELYCTQCHPAPYFTNFAVENNGLYADYTKIDDKGRFRINGDSAEIGSFKVPSLRNLTLTSPYMHDGSIEKLDDVLLFYSKGGNKHPNTNPVISPFYLSKEKRYALTEFFRSLEYVKLQSN